MNLINKTEGKKDRQQLPHERIADVYYYCNCCGRKFKPGRADASTCSDLCRVAKSAVGKGILMTPANLSLEQAQIYDQITLKLRNSDGVVKRMTYSNNGFGTFTELVSELKKEDPREDRDVEKEKLDEEELKLVAKKGKKIEPAPVNDKRLIPGEKGKEMDKLEKKEKKERKKKDKE